MLKPRPLFAIAAACCVALAPAAAAQSSAPIFRLPTLQLGPPSAFLVDDLDGDGRQDLAVACGSATVVKILLSQGNGSFEVAAVLGCGGEAPLDLASADLDADGRKDLVVARTSGQGLLVFRGLGGGQFALIDTLTADAYFGVETGDFDEDGRTDLVCAHYWTANVTLFLRGAHGGFAPGQPFTVSGQPWDLAVEDFDQDGHLDLLTTHQGQWLTLLYGDGRGGFSAPITAPVPVYANALAVADVNADTFPDVLTAHDFVQNQIHLLLGEPGGGFVAVGMVATAPSPADIAVGDLDGDGHADLVSTNAGNNSTFAWLGHGDGTFTFESYSFFSFYSNDNALGDFDGDSDLDLAVASPGELTVVVALGRGDGSFDANPVTNAAGTWRAVGDFDEDGRPDVVAAAGTTVIVSLGQGGPDFAQQPSIAVGNGLTAAVVDDFDADGHQDIAVASQTTGTVPILLGDGDGGFALAGSILAGSFPQLLAVGDIDGDGRRDLAVASAVADTVLSLLGTGDGGFVPGPTASVGTSAQEIAMADFDGDGRSDLALADFTLESVLLLRGQADGALLPYGELLLDGAPQALVAGDIDGDGRADIATGNSASNTSTVSVFNGLGNGGFGPAASWPVGNAPQSLSCVDLDGDGRRDLLSVNNLSGTLSVLLGGENGLFQPSLYHSVVYSSTCLVADFDGDGRPDALVSGSNSFNESRRLLQNQSGSDDFPWTNLGQPLAGAAGNPLLFGKGPLAPGTSGKLVLQHAASLAPAVLVASTSSAPTPFKGGVLVPLPALLTVATGTDAEGALTLPWLACPPGIPGSELYLQLAILDASAVAGVALSNAVRAELP